MAKGGGSRSGKRVTATLRLRDARGRFAYDGGRKKPPKKGRRRKVDRVAVERAGGVLSKAPSKSVSRQQVANASKAIGGLKAKRKTVSRKDVEALRAQVGGLPTKIVRRPQVDAIKSKLSGLPSKTTKAPEATKAGGAAKATTAPKETTKPTSTPGVKKPLELKARVKTPQPETASPDSRVSEGTAGTKYPKKADGSIRKPPTVRQLATRDHLEIGEDNKVSLWSGDNKHALKNHRGYKEGIDKDYEYAPMDSNGRRRVMPKEANIKATFDGEVVHYIPKHPDFSRMDDKALFNALADRVSRVETADRGGSSAGAPKVNGSRLEIHHVDQWSKKSFQDINLAVKDGRMSLDDAKKEMRSLLRPSDDSKEGYRIDVAPKGQRRLVVLRSEDHIGSSFDLNHPKGYHPDTGKPTTFGIPKTGDGGREWFDKWRNNFWDGYTRVEAYAAAKEVQRRLRGGVLTPDKAKDLWDTALSSQQKNQDYQRGWAEAYKAERASKGKK